MGENEQGTDPTREGVDQPGEPASEPEEPQAPTEPEPEVAGAKALSDALKGSFTVLKIAMIALAVFYVVKGVFYVQPQEVRFKLRFGRVVPSWGEVALRPGTVHIQWPWEEVEIVSTEERTLPLEEEFWTFYPQMVGSMSKKTSLNVRDDGFLITGDANIVHMQLRARYRVRNDARGALSYLFGVRKPEEVLKRLLMASTVKVVGPMKVMEVLKRQELFDRIRDELNVRVAAFEHRAGVPLGVEVVAVEATETAGRKNPTEPLAVSNAFLEAQNASSLREQLRDEGRLEAIAIEEDGKAKAEEIRAEAEGYRERLVQTAQADAEAMSKLLPVYNRSAEEANILRETFYQRALWQVLGNARGVNVLYEKPGREVRFILAGQPPLSPVETEEHAAHPETEQ